MQKFIYHWVPLILWMCVIFFFSSRPRVTVSATYSINFLFFKTLHVLEYSFLMMLALRAVTRTYGKRISWLSYLICVLYAVSDEVHQTFVPTREGRLRDVIIDTGGMTAAWILLTQYIPRAPKRLRDLAKTLQIV